MCHRKNKAQFFVFTLNKQRPRVINDRKEWAVGIGDTEHETRIMLEESFRANILWWVQSIDREDNFLF